MNRRSLSLSFLASCLGLISCTPPGELTLEVDTNILLPSELRVWMVQGSHRFFGGWYRFDRPKPQDSLPGTLVVTPPDGTELRGSLGNARTDDLGPVTVTFALDKGGVTKVDRDVVVSMPPSGPKRLRVLLELSCANVMCEDGTTCRAGECASPAIDVESLPDG